MKILGLNAFHGDASAALLIDGELAAAIEEERLNRIKHCAGFPSRAIDACFEMAGIDAVDHVAISRNPRAHVLPKIAFAAGRPKSWSRVFSRGVNAVRVAGGAAFASPALKGARRHNVEHHQAHLASAFFVSPFERAAVVSVDGFGDFTSVLWGRGENGRIQTQGKVRFPHSLGIFYTAFTQFLGFANYGDEYKMMGLAAYGKPKYAAQVREVVRTLHGDCRLNLDYFTHHTEGVAMTWEQGSPVVGPVFSSKMREVFGAPRQPRAELSEQQIDLAASVQQVFEENYFALLNFVHQRTQLDSLCLAGGVALNCAGNGKIFEHTPFRHLYVQPAANDSGTAIGAALHVQHEVLGKPRKFQMKHAYFGPSYSDAEIRKALGSAGAVSHAVSEEKLIRDTARAIADGQIVGWFQGRMEFGPRALGNRSILADPRRAEMKEILNRRIKYREPFRPFCPSIKAEAVGDFFETSYPAPFMVSAYRIRPDRRNDIPAVTHADGTGRLQTVEADVNPLYWKLLDEFERISGVPVLLNTSFNENEPIVTLPAEAIDCFLRTNMDVLSIGSNLLLKSENVESSANRQAFAQAQA